MPLRKKYDAVDAKIRPKLSFSNQTHGIRRQRLLMFPISLHLYLKKRLKTIDQTWWRATTRGYMHSGISKHVADRHPCFYTLTYVSEKIIIVSEKADSTWEYQNFLKNLFFLYFFDDSDCLVFPNFTIYLMCARLSHSRIFNKLFVKHLRESDDQLQQRLWTALSLLSSPSLLYGKSYTSRILNEIDDSY